MNEDEGGCRVWYSSVCGYQKGIIGTLDLEAFAVVDAGEAVTVVAIGLGERHSLGFMNKDRSC